MELARGYRANSKFELKGAGIGLYSDSFLIFKLPNSWVLRIVSRSLFMAMVIVALPSIGSIVRDSSGALYADTEIESSNLFGGSLPLVLKDLVDEGLLKKGHKGLYLCSDIDGLDGNLQFLNGHGIDLVVNSGLDRQSLMIPDVAFDFVLVSSVWDATFVSRAIKMEGIVIMPLSNKPLKDIQQQGNFKIVYLHRFESMVVAMRKMSLVGAFGNSQTTRRLCGASEEGKKAALRKLEDVLLEPPRRASAKSSNRKIKFLPNLLDDSLEDYKRRVFITDGENETVEWFYKNYPTRNKYFEIRNLDIEIDNKEKVVPWAIGIADWVKKNVNEEDYVVMKAEAGAVEEMIKAKTIFLVDELFLECKNQWDDDREKKKSERAYWQCLELYGGMRDDVVAVHQ